MGSKALSKLANAPEPAELFGLPQLSTTLYPVTGFQCHSSNHRMPSGKPKKLTQKVQQTLGFN